MERIPRCHQGHNILLLRQPESRVKRLQELGLVLVDERHGFLNAIKSQKAFGVVYINADAGELLHVQRRFHIAVPGGECASVPLEAPGKVISGDAAVALVAFAVDALVRDADVRALTTDVHLKVMSSQVETLLSQDLAPALEALR